jgi:hypothetical protein
MTESVFRPNQNKNANEAGSNILHVPSATLLAMNLCKGFLRFGLGRDEVAQTPRAAEPYQTGEACEPAQLRNFETHLRGES